MIKFEVGKVYRRLDKCFYGDLIKIMAIIEDTAVYKMDLTRTGDFKGSVFTAPIKVHDGYKNVEVMFTGISGQELMARADEEIHIETEKDEEPEANIEEVKEEDKKEKIKEDSDDWIVGKEYEAVCLDTNQKAKVKLISYDKDSCFPLTFNSTSAELEFSDMFEEYNDIAFSNDCGEELDKTVVIFKHGIKSILDWEEVKEDRKPVCFEVGKKYKACSRDSDIWELKAVFDANDGKIGIFYNKRTNVFLRPVIKTLNSVEYTTYGNVPDELDFIADEQYRNEVKALL